MIRLNRTIKKIINIMMLIMLIYTGVFFAFDGSDYSKLLYAFLYLILSVWCFSMCKHWICSLSLFWVVYTTVAIGYLIGGISYVYNSFVFILGSFAIMLLGYYVSNMFKIGSHLRFKHRRITIKSINISWNTILVTIYTVSTLLFVYYLFLNRGYLLGGNLEDGRISASSGNGLILYGIYLHIMTICLMYIQVQRRKFNKKLFYILTTLATIELLMLGFRTIVLILFLNIIIMNVMRGKITLNIAIGLFVFLYVLAIVYEIVRGGFGEISVISIFLRFIQRFSNGMYNINFVFRAFPEVVPFQHGYANIIDFIMLLPGPDPDFSMWLKDAVGMSYAGGGLGVIMPCAFYVDFGYIGVFVGMFIMGILKEIVDSFVYERDGKIGFWQVYLIYVFSTTGGAFAGSLIIPMIFAFVYFVAGLFTSGPIYLNEKIKSHRIVRIDEHD